MAAEEMMRQLRIVTCAAALSLIGFTAGCDPSTPDDAGMRIDTGGPDDGGTDGGGVGTDSGTDGGGGGACTGPTMGPCNVTMPASCGAGMACVMVGSTMDGWMTACIAAGVGGAGAACDPTMPGQCQEGFQCNDGGCRRICCVNTDCSAGDFCGMIGGANAGFCQTPDDCDLIAQTGCEAMAGTGCYPGSGGLQCASAGTTGEGATCMFVNECMPGMGCIGPMGGPSVCRRWCDTTVMDSCPMDFACTTVTGLPVGACTPASP